MSGGEKVSPGDESFKISKVDFAHQRFGTYPNLSATPFIKLNPAATALDGATGVVWIGAVAAIASLPLSSSRHDAVTQAGQLIQPQGLPSCSPRPGANLEKTMNEVPSEA
jgi:hypothetical protein